MKWPALSGNEVMAVIVVAAVDFAGARAGMRYRTDADTSLRIGLLVLGLLPMVNILALGLWMGRRYPASRRFLMGFNIFAAVETVLFLAGATLIDPSFLHSYNDPFIKSVQEWVLGESRLFTTRSLAVLMLIVSVIYVVPQVVIASIGGLAFRLFAKTTRPAV